MKDNINRLARGNFIYEKASVELSDKSISEQIETGRVYEKEFIISSKEFVKGVVYSTNPVVVIPENNFGGRTNNITYSVDTRMVRPQEHITGSFNIVSNLGEESINYDFTVTVRMCDTSIGKAYNMFHFANLVQTEPKEAQQLFMSDEFKNVFINDNEQLMSLYEVLKKSSDIQAAIEEFLVAVKKKMPVTFEVSDSKKTFNNIEEDIQEQLVITRNNWGYFNIDITSDADFINVQTLRLTEENFTGNRCIVKYTIKKDKLHAGLNLARITLKSGNTQHTVELEVRNTPLIDISRREESNALYNITKGYLDYRMRKEQMSDWLERSSQMIARLRAFKSDNEFYKLAQAQIFVMQGLSDDAEWLLNSVIEYIGDNKDGNAELYCYYLYVDSLLKKDDTITAKALNIVERYYENGHDDWRILWLILYLDVEREKNLSIKLARIKDMYHKGHRSPVMYYEAMLVMNEQPVLLRVLNDFELQVLYFGCRYGLVTEKLAKYVCSLISEEKIAHLKYLGLLEQLNNMFSDDDMLNVLVTHMIRNELMGEQYFEIYKKGILRKIRITRLYEFYMARLDKSRMVRLPKIVLMYFAYEPQLDYENKAYLYANVLTNEIDNAEVMKEYSYQIEQFAYEQMKLRHIDNNLCIIYRHIFMNVKVDDDNRDFLSRFVFAYKITCFDESITNVIVRHKEFDIEMSYPVINHAAFVQMYTDNCAVAFEDAKGIRRYCNVKYELERVFDNNRILSQLVSDNNCNNINITIFVHENNIRNNNHSRKALDNCVKLLSCDELEDTYKKGINSWIIDYYYNHGDAGEFMISYNNVEGTQLDALDFERLTDIYIENRMYNKAYNIINSLGFSGVDMIKLFRLCRYFIEDSEYGYDSVINNICSYLFANKKYDEVILRYMSLYHNSSNENMYYLWRACENFDVQSEELNERIVSQMMFTGELSDRLKRVFKDYYKNGADKTVTRAYICYNSYLSFVKLKKSDIYVYHIMEELIEENENFSDICLLALLKNYSENELKDMSDMQIKIAQAILDDMCSKNKNFEFYKKFKGTLKLPYNIFDKTIIEYRAAPDERVEIHYAMEDMQQFRTEVMKCQAGGVFTKEFTLFYGDSMKYYFTQDKNDESVKTDTSSIVCNECAEDELSDRFDYINEMIASRDMHDMVTLKQLMEMYCIKDYAVSQIFKPM